MLKRRLGRTNFEASVIGFGGAPFIRPAWQEGPKAVRRAIELGVNIIETARAYGDSEAIIGEAIKGLREHLFIASKSHFRTKEEVVQSIDESLRQLQIDKLDLIQIHGVDTEEDLEMCLAKGGALKAMQEAKKAGKIDYIGISGHQNKVLVKAIKTGEFDTVIATYNPLNHDAAQELFPLAIELDMGIMAMKPLDGGLLALIPEAVQFKVADRAICTAEAALRFALSNPQITTVLTGMVTVAEVDEDVPLGYVPQEMSTEEKRLLQERAKSLIYTFCQGCGYCLPLCPVGIDIPRVFRLQVLLEQYGLEQYARHAYHGYGYGGGFKAQVALCTDCQACMERCPSQLDIPSLLKKADAILSSD